ncbi:RNA polymerase subunit sigma, partial [bacterium]|nr:RNA polymerase subunit sigma [bacterium]
MMAPHDRHRKHEVIDMLLEKASVQGYLTTDDLLEASPEVGEDTERLSVIMLALRHRGVDVVDPEAMDVNILDGQPGMEAFAEPDISDTHNDTIGMYLKEMSRVPLLKADEEFELAVRIEDGRKAKADLLRTAGRTRTLERARL